MDWTICVTCSGRNIIWGNVLDFVWMYRGKSRGEKKYISQDNSCLLHYRAEHCRLLLELNDSVSPTESYWTTTQTMFRTMGFATRVQGLRNCDDILYSTYCHWSKCNALCSLLHPGSLCLGSDVPSNAIHQSPGFEWLEIGRGVLQRQVRLGAWHFVYFKPLKEQSVHWQQKSLYHDYGRRTFTVVERSCRSRQPQSVFFEHLRITSWSWNLQKCHLQSDKEFDLIVTHLNFTTWHSFLILSSLLELPSCRSVFL